MILLERDWCVSRTLLVLSVSTVTPLVRQPGYLDVILQRLRVVMPRNVFLLFSLAFALGCTVESPPVATEAPSTPNGSSASSAPSDNVAASLQEPEVQADDTGQSWTINGEAVDENGALVEDFEAAALWSSNGVYWNEAGIIPPDDVENVWKREGVLAARPANLATEISKGTFSLAIRDRPRAPVFVVNKDHTRGGIALVERSAADRPLRIELTPLVRVTVEIYCPEAGRTPDWSLAQVYVVGGDNIPLTQCGTFQGKVSFLLPAGEYEIDAYSESPGARRRLLKKPPSDIAMDAKYARGIHVTIPHRVSNCDLGVIDLVLPSDKHGNAVDITEFYGKKPPNLEITDARGVPKDVKLEDFHGKWVLLEFWALWCSPCVAKSLPELREFYDQHAADHDRFEILAICDTEHEGVRTIEAFDALSSTIVKEVWGGNQLPFPVLLDGEGRTSGAYGILGRPTLFLIDPEGNLVKDGDLKMLADKLRENRH